MTYQKVFTVMPTSKGGSELFTPRFQVPSGIISTLLVEAGVTPSSYEKTTSEHCWRLTSADSDKLKAYLQKEFPTAADLGAWVAKRKAAYAAAKASAGKPSDPVVTPGPGLEYSWHS